MTTTSETSDESFEVVVSSDGSLTVPAAELARHGVRPGAHLQLVKSEVVGRRGGRSAGGLAGLVPDEGFEVASGDAATMARLMSFPLSVTG
jgi:hypothetical protein